MRKDLLSTYIQALRDVGFSEEEIPQLMLILKILLDPEFKYEKLDLPTLSPEEIAKLLKTILKNGPTNTGYNLSRDIDLRERISYGFSSSSPISSSSGYGGGGGGGGCFIATAAYGTPFCKELYVLKTFREEVLSKTVWGRKFISVYYVLSPQIANHIRHRPVLRGIFRGVLGPFVELAKRMVKL